MNKKFAMATINGHLGSRLLEEGNTRFSRVNASKDVWWLNPKPEQFKSDLHIILVKEGDSGLIWLRIPGNSIPVPAKVFKFRQDKGCIDLEISSRSLRYMTDVKSGGSGYDFSKHIEREWKLTEGEAKSGVVRIAVEQERGGLWIAEAPEVPDVLVYSLTAEDAIIKAQALALRLLSDRVENDVNVQGQVAGWFQVI